VIVKVVQFVKVVQRIWTVMVWTSFKEWMTMIGWKISYFRGWGSQTNR